MPPKAEEVLVSESVDQDQLQAVALQLYAKTDTHGYTNEATALGCFKRAKVFLETAAKVRSGQLSAEEDKPLPNEMIEVPVWKQLSDEKWQPMTDELGRVVTEKQPVDRFAYAPNLPKDHPVNLRFKPVDGRSIAERYVTSN